MASKMTNTFIADFRAALAGEAQLLAPMEVYNNCMEVLKDHQLSYTAKLTANLLLTHAKNRGGLMLSSHRVHTNGAVIHAGGADRNSIVNAVAMEMAPSGPQREYNISKNTALIERSGDLLAPITGEERFRSRYPRRGICFDDS